MGASTETKISNIYFPISFLTYDQSSLFAGKIHAILNRGYTKGRDYYDLAWYLTRFAGIVPNFTLLNNACKQTGWQGSELNESNWRRELQNVIEFADWRTIRSDVEKYLENPEDMKVYTQAVLVDLLKK